MAEMNKGTFTTKEEANQAGWFSRRHRTNEAHIAAREAWKAKQDRKKA